MPPYREVHKFIRIFVSVFCTMQRFNRFRTPQASWYYRYPPRPVQFRPGKTSYFPHVRGFDLPQDRSKYIYRFVSRAKYAWKLLFPMARCSTKSRCRKRVKLSWERNWITTRWCSYLGRVMYQFYQSRTLRTKGKQNNYRYLFH